MSRSTLSEAIKGFVFSGMLLEDEFDRLEEQGIPVRGTRDRTPTTRVDPEDYSPQLYFRAVQMSDIYTAFFCLENSARQLVTERLAERHGVDWWQKCVPSKIKDAVEALKKKEATNRYHAQRATTDIGYTMFGNLEQIVIANWSDFSDLFPNQHWLSSRFNDLEMSRNIIMHTGMLPIEEIERIETISRDWIRQVG